MFEKIRKRLKVNVGKIVLGVALVVAGYSAGSSQMIVTGIDTIGSSLSPPVQEE